MNCGYCGERMKATDSMCPSCGKVSELPFPVNVRQYVSFYPKQVRVYRIAWILCFVFAVFAYVAALDALIQYLMPSWKLLLVPLDLLAMTSQVIMVFFNLFSGTNPTIPTYEPLVTLRVPCRGTTLDVVHYDVHRPVS